MKSKTINGNEKDKEIIIEIKEKEEETETEKEIIEKQSSEGASNVLGSNSFTFLENFTNSFNYNKEQKSFSFTPNILEKISENKTGIIKDDLDERNKTVNENSQSKDNSKDNEKPKDEEKKNEIKNKIKKNKNKH